MAKYLMVRAIECTDELAATMSQWDETWMVKDHGSKREVTPETIGVIDVAGAILLAVNGQPEAAAAVLRDEQDREAAAQHEPQKVKES